MEQAMLQHPAINSSDQNEERDAENWDRQFEADVASGRLDALAARAWIDFHEGRCRDL